MAEARGPNYRFYLRIQISFVPTLSDRIWSPGNRKLLISFSNSFISFTGKNYYWLSDNCGCNACLFKYRHFVGSNAGSLCLFKCRHYQLEKSLHMLKCSNHFDISQALMKVNFSDLISSLTNLNFSVTLLNRNSSALAKQPGNRPFCKLDIYRAGN